MEALIDNNNPEVIETIESNFEEVNKYKTRGRAKLIQKGVYEYRGKKVYRTKVPKSLASKIVDGEYIYHAWKIEGLDNKFFRKKSFALDFIDGFVK